MKTKVLLRAENLCAGYGSKGHNARDILHDITFTLHEGERLCVIGPNGCGKTTLLRVIAGTLPYKGSLSVNIQDQSSPQYGKTVERAMLKSRASARETGFLTQLTAAYFSFTVYDTVMLGRFSHQKKGLYSGASNRDKQVVETALKACGIQDIKKETIAHLSGGQLQRVFLARTFAQNPAVILLDEPTNHLDLFYQLELLRQLDSWIKEGTHGAIGVFHDLTLALRFADTLLLLDEGHIAAYGSPKTIIEGDAINKVYRMDVKTSMREILQIW